MSGPSVVETGAAELRCPACGNDGERGEVRYLVDGSSRTAVVALCAGVIELAGPTPSSARGARPRLECWALRSTNGQTVCRRQWDLPEGIRGITWRVRS
jgi:hypothetical protein